MADESAQKNGMKWLLVVLIVSAIFAVLIILGYATNMYKRNSPENSTTPAGINARG